MDISRACFSASTDGCALIYVQHPDEDIDAQRGTSCLLVQHKYWTYAAQYGWQLKYYSYIWVFGVTRVAACPCVFLYSERNSAPGVYGGKLMHIAPLFQIVELLF